MPITTLVKGRDYAVFPLQRGNMSGRVGHDTIEREVRMC
jgi:hypothetical protein